MKFFNNNYELDSLISMDEPDPLVQKIEKEIQQLFVDGGVKVVKINLFNL